MICEPLQQAAAGVGASDVGLEFQAEYWPVFPNRTLGAMQERQFMSLHVGLDRRQQRRMLRAGRQALVQRDGG
jgi:hypothetical protein